MIKKIKTIFLFSMFCMLVFPLLAKDEKSKPDFDNKDFLQGIDVSQYQGKVDWDKVLKDKKEFVIIRATTSVSFVDEEFETNWQKSKEVGLTRGAYHFFYASQDPIMQAHHFLSTVDMTTSDLPPVLDVETQSISLREDPKVLRSVDKEALRENVMAWLKEVETETGRKPMIYTASGFWDEYMDDSFADYPLWVANYETDKPKIPLGWESYNIWQYSSTSKVKGISGDVDANVFPGSGLDLVSFVRDTIILGIDMSFVSMGRVNLSLIIIFPIFGMILGIVLVWVVKKIVFRVQEVP